MNLIESIFNENQAKKSKKKTVKESYDPLEIGKEYIFKSILTPEDEITDSEYAFLADYSGKKCTIVAYAEDADPDLWTVEFEDGAVADVFGDELTPVVNESKEVVKESHDYDESSEDDRKIYEHARYSLNDLLDEFGLPLDYVVQVSRYEDTIKNIVYLVKSYYDGLNESIEYPDFVVKVSPGTDSRTGGQGYYFVYPERYNPSIIPREIWEKLFVTDGGAMHFPSEAEALEWIKDNIEVPYGVSVDVVS